MATKRNVKPSREEVLAACTALEEGAAAMYGSFAKRAKNAQLAKLFGRMHEEEQQHAAAVRRLAEAPMADLPIGREDLDRAKEHAARLFADGNAPKLDDERMVTIAAALEFSEIDDLFGIVCRAGGIDPERGRAEHIGGLVELASNLDGHGEALRTLLAAVVRLDRRAHAKSHDA